MFKYRYLSTEDQEAYKAGTLSEVDAKAKNARNFEIEQISLAKEFTRQVKSISAGAQESNMTDLELLSRCIEQTGDAVAGLDTFLYLRADYRAQINALNSDERTHIDYSITAIRAGEDQFVRYVQNAKGHNRDNARGTSLTSEAPGLANTVDVTVSQSIFRRAENNGLVLPLLAKITVPYGDYAEPYYNKYSIAGYIAENGTIPDIGDDLIDASNGLKKQTWNPRDFALGLEQSLNSLTKLSPSILNEIFNLVAEGLTRGMEYQAISGPGTGTTDSGIVTVATSITFDTNAYITFINACSNVGSKNVFNKVAVMNERAWGEFKKLRVIDAAYRDSINTKEKMIDDVKVIVVSESVMPTASNVATVVVGDLSHYLVVTAGGLKQYERTDPRALKQFTAFHTLRDGGARMSDSFAKFALNV